MINDNHDKDDNHDKKDEAEVTSLGAQDLESKTVPVKKIKKNRHSLEPISMDELKSRFTLRLSFSSFSEDKDRN